MENPDQPEAEVAAPRPRRWMRRALYTLIVLAVMVALAPTVVQYSSLRDRLLTAAPELVPQRLLEQLRPGGRMVLPVGVEAEQKLVVVEKGADHQVRTRELIAVRFSPLVVSH